jgi:hypothetical protein
MHIHLKMRHGKAMRDHHQHLTQLSFSEINLFYVFLSMPIQKHTNKYSYKHKNYIISRYICM